MVALKESNLTKIWRTCQKIRGVIFKTGLQLWNYFKRFDNEGLGLLSDTKFSNVLSHQLGSYNIDLTNDEIKDITEYFRLQNGQIAYGQFCSVLHDSDENHKMGANDLVSGLEWEDPLHENRLSPTEHRRVSILMTKIVQSIRKRNLLTYPYFQDYELESKNTGTVTLAHFFRILKFMGLDISSAEFNLLVKRFNKDLYTINYVAFLTELDAIHNDLSDKRLIDFSGDFKEQYPGSVMRTLPKLPRTNIKFDISHVENPVAKYFCDDQHNEIMLKLQRHIQMNGIRVHMFFEGFDHFGQGYITKAQFLRGLDGIILNGHRRIYLANFELENICKTFTDNLDSSRIDYRQFEKALQQTRVDKYSKKSIEIIEKRRYFDVTRNEERGDADNYFNQPPKRGDVCEEILLRIKAKITKRKIDIYPFFKMFDKFNSGHISNGQFQRVLSSNGILVSSEEMRFLENRYSDDMGLNYKFFLKEADPKPIPMKTETPDYFPNKPPGHIDQHQLFAKIKGIVTRNGLQLLSTFSHYDIFNHQYISENHFCRGLHLAGIILSTPEIDLLCKIFKYDAKNNKRGIDYRRFCQIFDPVENRPCLEKTPLVEPVKYLPSVDGAHNFLNFEERLILSKALDVLKRHCDQVSNLSALFDDFDRRRCGSITRDQFLRALTVRKLNFLLSSREFEVIFKCFGVERGMRLEFNYRLFLKVLDISNAIRDHYPI